MDNISLIAYKPNSSPKRGKEATSNISNIWLGIWEYKFLKCLFEKGLTMFRLSDIDIELDSKRKHDVAKRLLSKGFIEKLGYNLYRVVVDVARILGIAKIRDTRYNVDRSKDKSEENKRGKEAHGTRIFVGGGVGFGGVVASQKVDHGSLGGSVELFFDNVRGYISRVYCYRDRCSKDLVYVNGDRDRTLSWWQVNSLYERVSYSEIGYRVFGGDPFDVLDGVVVIYSNMQDLKRFGSPSIRVEYRAPKGYVKRNGLVSTIRLGFYELLKAWKALTKAILYQASQNLDYLNMFVEVFRSIAGMKILCSM